MAISTIPVATPKSFQIFKCKVPYSASAKTTAAVSSSSSSSSSESGGLKAKYLFTLKSKSIRLSDEGKKRILDVGICLLGASVMGFSPLDANATRIEYYATVAEPSCEPNYVPSGLGYCDIAVGSGPEAPYNDLINVHYTARFADETVFDSSYKRARPLTMRIGVGKVIKGLDQGILGGCGVPPMHVGGKRKLRIPPALAYGPEAAGCFSGALFGVIRGLVLVVLNATAGASSCYFLSKLIGRPLVSWLWPEKLKFFQGEIAKRREKLLNYMLFLRVTPTLPNLFINLASPIVDIPFHVFFLATLVGLLPASFITVKAGLALGELKSVKDLYDFKTLMVLFFIGSVAIFPVLLKRKRTYE